MSPMRYTGLTRWISGLGNYCCNLLLPARIVGVVGRPQADRLPEVRE